MTYIFNEKSKYPKNTVEQVALKDYLHLVGLLDFEYSSEELKKNINEIFEKLNNFIPISACKACGKDPEYFPMEVKTRQFENPYNGRISTIPDLVEKDLDDLRCGEHVNSPNRAGLSYRPIKFNLLKSYSREPQWVIEEIQKTLLELAGFSGMKTKKNCGEFFKNLKQRSAIEKPKNLIEIIKPQIIKPYQSGLF
ncbi:MAG: hypothetical protein KKE23_04220 [Nanoarchaeota archaeon]|nr:hypothetical protein [Nanoarchaeota archaeon]